MRSAPSVLVFLASVAFVSANQVTPVQKVIQLLNGMIEKGKKEKHEEMVQFNAYQQFCQLTQVQKQDAISDANEQIEILAADISEFDSQAEALAEKIAKHDGTISTAEGDLKQARNIREIENEDFVATQADYTSSIHALDDGIETLKAQQAHTGGVHTALNQIAALPKVPEEARKAILAFVQHGQDPEENLAVSAPEANAYESQAGGIIDMITKLRGKFEDERGSLEDEEMKARQSFEMEELQLTNLIDKQTKARTEKSEEKAKALQAAADARGDKADTTQTRDDDSKYLQDLTTTCQAKAQAFAARQDLRADEISAIEKAVEILSSGSVAGMSEKHLPQLVQVKKASPALAQLRSGSATPAQLKVAAFLKGRAEAMGSRMLSALAVRVSEDPFKKVKKMIRDLVVKLMEEANEEAQQKGFCDQELATNEQTRKEKQAGVETLTAEIDELNASISQLSEQVADLTKAVAELDAAVAKSTNIREEEKEKNAATVKDAREAQTAVAQALSVLKEFYYHAGDATALVQEPEIFSDEPYKGMQSENGGVVGMIEVIQSDFARLEAETVAAEDQAQKEYDQFMQDSAIDKGQKSTDIQHKSKKKQNDEKALQERTTDLAGMQKELDAANAYFEKLKPSCLDASESYEDRVARRKEEIQSLQEALKILSGDSV
jgi:predicted  nucleic acid-binding Zn-ribbon protein